MRKKPGERYVTIAPPQVILPSYKEMVKGQAWRRSKKKERVHDSQKNEELKIKDESMSSTQRQGKKKARNGRAQKIQAIFNFTFITTKVFNFTNKIQRLASHLELHKKDFSSERGLRRLLGKRQCLLAYLAKKNRVRMENKIYLII
ncbi:hypothetical protein EJB05_16027, partial [Eragrostis curvula]